MIILAILCAAIGTVLSLLGPDKLSELTDLITSGMMFGIDMAGVRRICFTLVASTSAVSC